MSFELARLLRRIQGPAPAAIFLSAVRAPHLAEESPALHALPEPEFIRELRRLNGTPAEILAHAELMELLLPVLRADFAVCETYQYHVEPPLNCPIAVFGGSTDPHVPVHHLDSWKEMTVGEFSKYLLPGGHFFLQENDGSFFQILATILRRVIAKRT